MLLFLGPCFFLPLKKIQVFFCREWCYLNKMTYSCLLSPLLHLNLTGKENPTTLTVQDYWAPGVFVTLAIQPEGGRSKTGATTRSGPAAGPDVTTKACEVLFHLFKPLSPCKSACLLAAILQGCSGCAQAMMIKPFTRKG